MPLPLLTPDHVTSRFKRHEQLLQRRASYEQKWQNLAHLMRPSRASIRWHYTPGTPRTQQLFDGTALQAAHDLASALSGSFTSTEFQFFGLKMRYQPLNEDWETQMWLEEVAQRMFLALQQSNFGSESNQLYQDLVVFGTGCMWMESKIADTGGFGGLQFRTMPIGKYVLSEEFDGSIKTLSREFSLPAHAVATQWPGRASEKVKHLLERSPDEMVAILHTMQPLRDNTNDRQQFESRYFEKDSKQELAGAAYRNFRYLVPRWDKASDEEYGSGQGDVAYPDTASLNRAVEMRFKQWAKAIDPPILTVDDGVIGKLRMTAGTRTVVRNLDAVREFQTSAKFDVANFAEEQLRQMIRNAFFADQIQLPNKPYMTAFEIQSLLEIMQRRLGPQLGRLKEEYARPLLTFVFEEMWQGGEIPPPPALVQQAQAQGLATIDVEYESPLTRVQRTSTVTAIERTLQVAGPLAAAAPDVTDNLDTDETFRTMAETNGVPSKLLRSLDAREKIRAARQQAEAERAQAEMGQLQSGNLKNMAQAAQAAGMTQPQGGAPPA
jgi:hypothetical protein